MEKDIKSLMPTLNAPRAMDTLPNTEMLPPKSRPWRRVVILGLLLLIAAGFNTVLIAIFPQAHSFVVVWLLSFAPYAAACLFVLLTREQRGGWRWVELGIIFTGALILRAMLVPLPPNLSHDSWRYLWDARVTLHGYSPYVYAPENRLFNSLHDYIYDNSRFRTQPTIYPPGAQAVFLLSYLLAPSNLFFLKGIFMVCDLATCAALAWLLARRGLDPRRAIIYAWCPLPIVEYAIQGHVDVITITFMVLAILCATFDFRGSRVLTGFLIGLAILTKIYPIFLLIVLMRRRDWQLLVACLLTVAIGYLPFYILGHGEVFGYFARYAREQGGNAGIIQLATFHFLYSTPASYWTTIVRQHIIEAVFAGSMALLVIVLRLLWNLSMEAATLLLTASVFAISSHVFPWYAATLLPWVAVLIVPLWTRRSVSGQWLAVLAAWYFACITIIQYLPPFGIPFYWQAYYYYVYYPALAGLGIALIAGTWNQIRHYYRLTLEGTTRDTTTHA